MRKTATSVFLMILACAPLHGAKGRTPILEPTTITSPGHYVVAWDISATSGPVIDIRADGVTLDLNGHTVSLSSKAEAVIRIGGGGAEEKGIIVIGGGKVEGGLHGIHALDTGNLSLTNLNIRDSAGTGVKVDNLDQFEARGIIIVGGKVGMQLQGSGDGVAQIVGAHISAENGVSCSGVTCNIQNSVLSIPSSGVQLLDDLAAKGIVIVDNMPVGVLSDLAAKGIIIIENMPVGVLSDLAAKGIIIVSGIAR